jgi:hypothetical protein
MLAIMPQMLMFPDPRPLVERLGREYFRQVPECPGVYLMRDAAEIVLLRRQSQEPAQTAERLSRSQSGQNGAAAPANAASGCADRTATVPGSDSLASALCGVAVFI